jgi:pyruvate dehydrogenase E2 component (dihydrolipoamide acetyltransferase)
MATKDVSLPEIGEGVTEGELVKWLVKPGDSIKPDQPVAEMMTDKATVEVPSPVSGTVKELKAKEGDVIQVGQALISVELGGAAAAESAPAKSAPAQVTPAKPAPAPAAPAMAAAGGSVTSISSAARPNGGAGGGMDIYPPPANSNVLATPHTRRLAREMGVDINNMQGTGLAGRVTREDVLSGSQGAGAVAAGAPSYQPSIPRPAYQGPQGAVEERVALRGIRKKIAENMQMAKHIVPHFTLMDEANVTELVHLREQTKATAEKLKVKVTYLPYVIKALIATIREYPQFNASIDDAKQEIVYKKYFNIGFAADTPQGLLVPVIRDADRKSILQLSQEITDLATRARDGKLKPEEMKGATITITNIGSVGGTYATPIINHPEVAILGMYKIQDKPVIEDGELKAIKVMNFTITADHRLIDGAVAANFLRAFFSRIENPSRLMLDMA